MVLDLSPPHVDISKPIVNENTQYHKSRVYLILLDKIVSTGKVLVLDI